MSPLWPKKLSAGLFPGHCWIGDAVHADAVADERQDAQDPEALLASFDSLLLAQTAMLAKGGDVTLVVSDSVAMIATLPWRDALLAQDEVNAYARICFEQQGIDMDERWVMHAAFLTFRGAGLAYALPRQWLDKLVSLLGARGLRLARVLPLSALAYSRQCRFPSSGQAVILLREAERASALVYDKTGLRGIDAEALVGNAELSGARLLRRIGIHHPDIRTVWDWPVSMSVPVAVPDYIATCLPAAVVHPVPRHTWG
ncbi:hypothetical protein RBA41_08275 [Massilia sp. CCM 9210]|uniref:hypothetical protein n=1 Tax=Massilia scottii TaxID=3057166 RepID=UPI002796C51E|nr:hypothetical protein [Massilia sp. CCM 9210]MDQ1813297.1 hypothetical protein [Massilia sp. CCM 9210]